MHPGDFTPVCTTELGRAASLESEFAARNVKLCGFSCNDGDSHRAWIEDILHATGAEVTFPLFCDPTREESVKLGILDQSNKDDKGLPLTVRSVFILKPDRTVALIMSYPASTGRNFDEILRVVDSLQLTAEKNTATPVDWKQGDEVIVNFPLTDAMADEIFGKVRRIALGIHLLIEFAQRVWSLSHLFRMVTALWTCRPSVARSSRSITCATRRCREADPRCVSSSLVEGYVAVRLHSG
jgi:1-Cys peroxiredoxin 6